ncbi:hypothetical protein NEAUS03_2490, partial [Nematocida ausubeli]
QLLLILCIGYNDKNIRIHFDNINIIKDMDPIKEDDISLHVITTLISCAMVNNQPLGVANIVAAYAQIYWYHDRQCISKIMKMFYDDQRSKIIEHLRKYCSVVPGP